MPLSEHEQKLLDQIEQALYAEDPKFASAVRSARSRSRVRQSILVCLLGVVAGLALVLVGLITAVIVLSVVGFVLVVGSCGLAVHAARNKPSSIVDVRPDASRSQRQAGLRTRMEDRLRRRFEEN